jgi:hypothetical protein
MIRYDETYRLILTCVAVFARYAIQCLLGSMSREWMRSPSCESLGSAALWYTHPTPEAVERAFERLRQACGFAVIEPKRQLTRYIGL